MNPDENELSEYEENMQNYSPEYDMDKQFEDDSDYPSEGMGEK